MEGFFNGADSETNVLGKAGKSDLAGVFLEGSDVGGAESEKFFESFERGFKSSFRKLKF